MEKKGRKKKGSEVNNLNDPGRCFRAVSVGAASDEPRAVRDWR